MSKMTSGKQKISKTAAGGSKSILPAFFLSVIIFFLISFSASMDNILEKSCALIAALFIVFLCFGKKINERLKESAGSAFFALCAYVLLGGFSTFYALAGKFAISEFSKILIAFCVYLYVFTYTKRSLSGFRAVASMFASVGAVFGIISVDAASSNVIAKLFKSFFSLFTQAYTATGAYQQGVRISTILGNANIYAGFMAISVILSLALVLTSKERKEHIFSAFLLGINALCYLLAFSMGSIFMCAIAVIIMIFATKKGERIGLVVLTFETGLVTVLMTAVSMVGLGKASYIPLLAVVLSGILLYVLDAFVRPIVSELVNKNSRLFIGIISSLIVLVVIYIIVGLKLTAPAVLSAGETLSRSIYPSGGEYTLTVNASSPITLSIDSQNKIDLMKRTRKTLYYGASESEIKFTVPQDSKIVNIVMTSGAETVSVNSVAYEGESGKHDIPLKYKLIPAIIANRLQNIGANENAVQRTVFFEDGLKMFRMSPILGRGLGGFENGIFSVQDYYYETKYAHNHYIQVLADLGIIGFVLFIAVLGFSASILFKGRKKEQYRALIPVLSACLFQMAGQGSSDVIWSSAAFLPFAFAVLALISVFFGEPIALQANEVKSNAKRKKNSTQMMVKSGICMFAAVFAVLISGNIYAKALTSGTEVTVDTIRKCITLDAFETNDYILSFVLSAPKSNNEAVMKEAEEYAEKLSKIQSNAVQTAMIDYYFETRKEEKAFEIAKTGILYTKSNPSIWSKQFDSFEKAFDPVGTGSMDLSRVQNKDFYVDKILDAYKMLQETNKIQMDEIMLSPKNNAFIGKIMALKPLDNDDWSGSLSVLSRMIFDSKIAVDVNRDFVPDSIKALSGNTVWNADGCKVLDAASIQLETWHKIKGVYRISVLCNDPSKISAFTIEETTIPVQYAKGEAFALIKLEDNSFDAPLTVKIDINGAVDISEITVKKDDE